MVIDEYLLIILVESCFTFLLNDAIVWAFLMESGIVLECLFIHTFSNRQTYDWTNKIKHAT